MLISLCLLSVKTDLMGLVKFNSLSTDFLGGDPLLRT